MSISSDTQNNAVIKTLFLTDLVDSTKLFERLGDERAAKVSADYDRVARDLLDRFNGREIDKTDGFLLLFDRPIDATRYALAYQSALVELSVRTGVSISGRIGVHLGEVFLRENSREDVARGAKPLEVEGLAKHTVARVASLARGGRRNRLGATPGLAGSRPVRVQGNRRAPRHLRSRGRRRRTAVGAPEHGEGTACGDRGRRVDSGLAACHGTGHSAARQLAWPTSSAKVVSERSGWPRTRTPASNACSSSVSRPIVCAPCAGK